MPEKKKTPGALKKPKKTTKSIKKVTKKPKKVTKKTTIDKELRAIYADSGRMPNLKKLDTKKGSWFKGGHFFLHPPERPFYPASGQVSLPH